MSDAELGLLRMLSWTEMPTPETEYRFDATRRWRFDIAWPDRKVAVEVEGGTFVQGRHSRGRGFQDDCLKYNEAALQGWLVLRVTPTLIDDGRALDAIERALKVRAGTT